MQGRCISVAGANLASWQCLLAFIVANSEEPEVVINILEILGEQVECVIRCSFHAFRTSF